MKKLLLSIVFLGLSSAAMAELSATCQTYFDKIDNLIKSIPDETFSSGQGDMIKQDLESGKTQISAMPKDQQENACKQGVEILKQLEASMPKK